MQVALAKRAARQTAAERAAARQRRGKRKVGEHEDAAEGKGNAAAPSTRQEAARPGTMATTTVAPPDRQAVEEWGQVVVLRLGQPGSQALHHKGPVVGRVQLGLVFCAAGGCQTSRLL